VNYEFASVLALAPHADDVELGAGGSLARWISEGKEVFYVAFSIAEKSVPEGLPKDILEQEAKEATKVLGIAEGNLRIYKFEARTFPKFRQEILELLVSLREELKPDLVLMPSLRDMHQDHHVVAEEGIRAFKHTTILSYELPWNLLGFEPQAFIALGKNHLDRKMRAIGCYQSQKARNYANKEFFYGLAKTRGVQANCAYAEAFEVVRWIVN
jgi:LmbE family N-acetylglucosaminyl deacetylase